MIIDNDLDFSEAAKSTLEHAGYEVYLAQSGKRGLESAKKERPELVILDAMLPDMDGFSVCRDIKDDPGLSTVRVIVLTALAASQDSYVANIAKEHKADAFVFKPIDTKTLLEKVSSFLLAAVPMPKEAHAKARILLIDDDTDFLNATRQILLANQYEVITAKDGTEGITKAKYENPDLIVLDVILPGKDGYTVCYELRKIEQTRPIPVILFTAFGKQLSKPEYAIDIAIDHLADDYIDKSVDTHILMRKIEKLLKFEGKV
jgi:DNA-binding response OmpR family regulator